MGPVMTGRSMESATSWSSIRFWMPPPTMLSLSLIHISTVILAKTVKGKGVSFMENNAGWHGKAPNDEQFATAKAELEAVIKELEG